MSQPLTVYRRNKQRLSGNSRNRARDQKAHSWIFDEKDEYEVDRYLSEKLSMKPLDNTSEEAYDTNFGVWTMKTYEEMMHSNRSNPKL